MDGFLILLRGVSDWMPREKSFNASLFLGRHKGYRQVGRQAFFIVIQGPFPIADVKLLRVFDRVQTPTRVGPQLGGVDIDGEEKESHSNF